MIIHICGDCKGGTEKYINDLIKLYPQYKHEIVRNTPFEIKNIDDIKLIHIHSVFFDSNIRWEILNVIKQIKKFSNKVLFYLTIHDYQWIFEDNAYYTIENRELCKNYYIQNNNKRTIELFNNMNKIFIPTQRVFDNYKYFMNNELTLTIMNKMHIIPHCDIIIRNEQLYVPLIQSNKIINIAFVGQFNEYKGGRLFLDLIYNFKTYNDYKIIYHIFGKHSPSEYDNLIKDYVYFHGSYKDTSLIQDLYDNNIHLITSFSLLEETYCYALSLIINSGLPIIYLNRGSLLTRICDNYPRIFSCNDTTYVNIEHVIKKTLEYIIENQGHKDLITLSNELILNNEYKNLYLQEE